MLKIDFSYHKRYHVYMISEFDLKEYEAANFEKQSIMREEMLHSLQTGFIYVGHDMPVTAIDEIYEIIETFFGMPEMQKKQNSMFSALGSEKAEISDTADYKEMLNWGTQLKDNYPLKLKYPHRYKKFDDCNLPAEILLNFSKQILEIQSKVLAVIAESLKADPCFFDRMIEYGPTGTRAIHYPSYDVMEESHVWAAEHDDINLITALPRSTAKGLQILVDDVWVDASPEPDSMIINTGIMMEHLTNGKIPAGRHRVVSDGTGEERYSVVQFCHPTPGTILQPLQSCVSNEYPQKFDAVTAEEKFENVIWKITDI